MEPIILCRKCNKFRVSNKTHQLCIFCNFERLHGGLSISQYRNIKNTESKLKKAQNMQINLMRDTLLNPQGNCCIQGCTNRLYTKKDGGYCQYHWNIKKKNEKIKDNKPIHRWSNIKPITDKKKTVKAELSKIKQEEKQKYVENNGCICEGCRNTTSTLDYSHILSVKQREDLQNDRDNKNLLCRKCHENWESWNPKKMFSLACIWYNINYIAKNDTETFYKIYFKCIDNMMLEEAKKMDEIINELDKSN